MITLIAAMDETGAIGRDDSLPWDRIREDMIHFRTTTTGHIVIMGRKTFESLGKPLPNRRNIVLTRDPTWQHEGVEAFTSVEDILAILPTNYNPYPQVSPNKVNAFVIGGAEIYNLFLPHADRLILTHIPGHYEADTYWKPDLINWYIGKSEVVMQESFKIKCAFVTYWRIVQYQIAN